MSIFRLFVLQEKTQKTLSTLRYRTFAIGAYFEKVGNTLKLKIALTKKRRKWFVGIWDYPIDLSQKISTAWFGLNDVNTYVYNSTPFSAPGSPKLKLFDCDYGSGDDIILNNPLSAAPNNFVIWDNVNKKINVPQQLLGQTMTINISLKYQETTSNSDASRFVAYTGNAVYSASAGTVTGGTKIKDLMFKKTKTSGFTTVRDELVLSPIIITQEIINNGIKLYLGSGDTSSISFYEPVLTIDYGVVNITL